MADPQDFTPDSSAPAGFVPDAPTDPTSDALEGAHHAREDAAVATALAAHLTPYVQHALEAFATRPNVPADAAKIGRVIGGITSLPAGLSGFGDVQKGVWAGGKSGWFTGKLAQELVQHIAKFAEAVTPYLKAVGTPVGVADIPEGTDTSTPDDAMMKRLVSQGFKPDAAAQFVARGNATKAKQLLESYGQ